MCQYPIYIVYKYSVTKTKLVFSGLSLYINISLASELSYKLMEMNETSNEKIYYQFSKAEND